ncbi:hypothetical protein EC973_000395 [Apophysomyces ossiformis]|uniref:Methyltransferase type 11 domain-containing protein n=1 Tax=Apophysomyces ossiformis TaxID=679940 RepID=A0A8H7BNH0_9FUNG|nr:hypothetical protein EC973_000395 [Apophysomyces ossiformis]
MGNTFSYTTSTSSPSSSASDHRDVRSFSLNNRYHIPKHLRPIKTTRKMQKKLEQERTSRKKTTRGPILPQETNGELDRIFNCKKKNKSSDDESKDDEQEEDQEGIFRWHKGRRFINLKGIRYPLPADQTNLDRLRVEYYLCRWAFRGNVLAPIEEKLRRGIKVLNVSCGPGLWLGHPIIDMALDFRRSDFTAVDLCDLLPIEQLQRINESYNDQQIEPTTSSHSLIQSQDNYPTHSISPHIASVISRCPDFTTVHPALSCLTTQTQSTVFHQMAMQPIASISTHTKDLPDQQGVEEPDLSERETQSCPSTITPNLRQKRRPKQTKTVLNNLRFHQLNVLEEDLPFKDDTFDYVQQSLVALVYSTSDWSRVLSELVRVTKPGGYIQLTEVDLFIHQAGPKAIAFQEEYIRVARQMKEMLETAGLHEVEGRFVSIPIGCWGLDIGILWKENFDEFMRAAQPFLTSHLGLSSSEFKQKWRDTVEELNQCKTFSNIHAAWGHKPAAATTQLT